MLAYPGTRARTPRKARPNKEVANVNNNTNTNNTNIELEEGVVFLPFCAHVCKELVGGIGILKKYFAITFVKKSELPGHALWKGTMNIDGNVMQHRLGKRLDQEEIYCTFQPKDIYESMEDAHVAKDEVMKMLLSIEDFENIRMIRLRPLRQHEPPSVFRKALVEPEVGGFIGLNWTQGLIRFKEYRRRGKNKPIVLPPPTLPKMKLEKKIAKATKKKKAVAIAYSSGSEVETEDSDYGDSVGEIDTDSDSSSDEESVDEEEKGFDALDPKKVPLVTHFYPYPALDIESYINAKESIDNDRVMTSWAKMWGPKSSRKKNRRQDINKNDYQRFRKTQRVYLSRNNRLPDPHAEHEDGYKWTLVDETEVGNKGDGEERKGNIRTQHRAVRGWKRTLEGDEPDIDLVPKIVEVAKRDNESIAGLQLFEMKNPGLKTYSRAWLKTPYLSCYQIPQHSVLIKMDLAEKANKKLERKFAVESNAATIELTKYRQYDSENGDEGESKLGSVENRGGKTVGAPVNICKLNSPSSSSSTSKLFQFADLASSAPTMSDDFVTICKGSKGLLEMKDDLDLPPFKPRLIPKHLCYNLNPHNNFPRELFRLLQDAKEKVVEHILCWQKRGRSFIVKDHDVFETIILSQCCEETDATYKSFLNNITRYGFSEIQIGKRKGGYRHNLFQRGKPQRLDLLTKRVETFVDDDGFKESRTASEKDVEINEFVVQKLEFTNCRASRKQFLENLYEVLHKSKSLGCGGAIHWEEGGKSFKVHKLNDTFSTQVLKDFFSLSRYSSFKNELMDRGFKCKDGKKYGIFEHQSFVRSQRTASGTFDELKLKKRKRKPESEAGSNSKNGEKKTEPEVGSNSKNGEKKIESEAGSNSKNGEKKTDSEAGSHSMKREKKTDSEAGSHSMKREKKTESEACNNSKKGEKKTDSEAGSHSMKRGKKTESEAGSNFKKGEKQSNTEPTTNETSPRSRPGKKIRVDANVQAQNKRHLHRWTLEERQIFIEAYNEGGRSWVNIAKLIPTRTTTQVKSFAHGYMAKLKREKRKQTKTAQKGSINNQTQKILAKSNQDEKNERRYEISRNHNLPKKLHKILEGSEESGFSAYVRWLPQGDSFEIVDQSLFVQNILKKHTELTRFSAFESALKSLGFENIECKSRTSRQYRHKHFVRDHVGEIGLIESKVVSPRSNTKTNARQENRSFASSATKHKTTKAVCDKSKNGTKIPSKESVRISSPSSESETTITSPEKENSNLDRVRGSGIFKPVYGENAMEPSATVNNQCTNGLDYEKSVPTSDSGGKSRLNNSSSRIRSRAFSEEKECVKKRKVAQQKGVPSRIETHGHSGITSKNNHNSVGTKTNIVAEEYGQSVLIRNQRSVGGGVQEMSNEEKSVKSIPRRGEQSSNKIVALAVK